MVTPDPAALRILRVRDASMEPALRDGDRLVVDTARRVPAPGELFVRCDGDGLVVKRDIATSFYSSVGTEMTCNSLCRMRHAVL